MELLLLIFAAGAILVAIDDADKTGSNPLWALAGAAMVLFLLSL